MATCSEGHAVQYRFDWGDATFSGWAASRNASKAWDSAGTYQLRVQIRCAADATVLSAWSPPHTVSIGGGGFATVGDTESNAFVAITLRGVRTATTIGSATAAAGHLFLIVDVHEQALQDNQNAAFFYYAMSQIDGEDLEPHHAMYNLENTYAGKLLGAGEATEGELVFEVSPGQAYYTLKHEANRGTAIYFRFAL